MSVPSDPASCFVNLHSRPYSFRAPLVIANWPMNTEGIVQTQSSFKLSSESNRDIWNFGCCWIAIAIPPVVPQRAGYIGPLCITVACLTVIGRGVRHGPLDRSCSYRDQGLAGSGKDEFMEGGTGEMRCESKENAESWESEFRGSGKK